MSVGGVIDQERKYLESSMRLEILRIREKELQFFFDNFSAILTSSSLLAGFSFSGYMSNAADPNEENQWSDWCFFISITIAFGSNLTAAIIATLSQIYGPGLALRGGEAGSMNKAINSMSSMKLVALRFFEIGIVALLVASLCWAWKTLEFAKAVTVTIGNVITCAIIGYYIIVIPALFHAPREVTGEIVISDGTSTEIVDGRSPLLAKTRKPVEIH